ncbi:Sugar kinase of the NBD/HSP70 family, may contain an N-terminal HTH domain [Paraoerskovia marina]|uniref:Sugar kinase of the NBD/HSP70 family, may contain an N-terminal HTH domain n=1 Tax=Paraoerskovia marina TaxID=545619 RepID=A0A1H1VRM6_9CELL|nr:ROK family protein [Paraoerskovia marina]SDS87345.1 Sugar kinase of the NBD/HSP70 family, may contain an N-terminal HTH domain [Paraoerskovia marina]
MPTPTAARQQSLREQNLALVARAVFDAPRPPSRAAVAHHTGLTRATVSSLVDLLVRAGIVAELAPRAPKSAGRPAVPLVAAPRTIVGLGLELNVDYVAGRVVDLAGTTVAEAVQPGDFHDTDPTAALGLVGQMARALVTEVEAQGMRVAGARLALPGLVDVRHDRLQVAPNLGWSTLDPLPLLGLPDDVPAHVANEANLAGLAQLRPARTVGTVDTAHDDVPGPGTSSYLYVSGDVGIGAAIVVDGELWLGRHGWGGEIGHVVVDPAGTRCRCGATGCLEQSAGKAALLRAAGLPSSSTADDLARAADDGDPRALAALASAGRALGTVLAGTINLLDLDTVLLGGVYAVLADHLVPTVRAELDARVLASPWAPVGVRTAPVSDYAATTGGAQDVLRAVVESPSALVEEARA